MTRLSCHLFNKCHSPECSADFIKHSDHQKYCSSTCQKRAADIRSNERRRNQGNYKSYHNRTYKPVDRSNEPQVCVQCGSEFTHKHLLQVPLCSEKCRVKRSNSQVKNKCSLKFSQRTSGIKRGAKKRGIEFNLTQLPPCPTHCPVLGTEFYSGGKDTWASLDRIDNNRGYEDDNVWWISYRANQVKSDSSFEELAALVDALRSL